jgi:DNA-binding NarL/FixJ family response regulator
METMHVAIADDHPIFRSGLKFLLETSFENIVINQFENGEEIFDFVKTSTPDIIIVDIDMPIKNGLEVCELITQMEIDSKVIVLTMYKDIEMLKLAFYNGAKGYLVKDNTSEELVDCIQTVMEGKTYMAKDVRELGANLFSNDKAKFQISQLIGSLTQTELKTLKLVSLKLSSKEIANLLFVSVKSVENYRSRICKKLNLDARNNSLLLWIMDNKIILDNIKEFD